MDKVDFDYEIGEALGGNQLFSSEEDLRKRKTCTASCGVVKVEVKLIEVIQDSCFTAQIEKVRKARKKHHLSKLQRKRQDIKMYQKMIKRVEKEIELLRKMKSK